MSSGPIHAFQIITKPIGPVCNLDCAYCFYLEKERLYPGTRSWRMTPEVLERYIRSYIEAQNVPVVTFVWQGGEPTLLGLDFFRQAVAWQNQYANGKRIDNCFQTNGVLLDGAWTDFFAREQFLVGLSIDGPAEFNDRWRVDKQGHGTFDKVLAGLEQLRRSRVEFNTLTCVHRQNGDHPLEIYRFLKQIGSRYLQFIPIVERVADPPDANGLTLVSPAYAGPARVSDWSVQPLQYGEFMRAIFDEWVRHDVGRYFVQMFDVALENWLKMPASLCVFRETCGGALAIEHNGDLYSCDHFVYPEYRLGNLRDKPLLTMVESPEQAKFGTDKRDTLPRYCRDCEVRFACHGECPKHRFTLAPDGEAGLNYLCAGYKLFFTHVGPYMSFMADELRAGRPPANVMQYCRRREAEMRI